MRVSIAMAVYNGEKYLREQLESIICQLKDGDELVISFDKSTDSSKKILEEYAHNYENIIIYDNPYDRGYVNNFQNAIVHCTGDIIFYSDQDDVWLPNKIETVINEFEDSRIAVVVHDSYYADEKLNIINESTFSLRGGARTTFWGNLYRQSYIGCCMAFRSEYKEIVLPAPSLKSSLDWWTASILSCGKTKLSVIHKPLIYHRIHSNNTTPSHRKSIKELLSIRYILLKNVICRFGKKIAIDKKRGL